MRAWVWVWMLLVLPLRLWAAVQMPLAVSTSPLPAAHAIPSLHAPHPAHSPTTHYASLTQPPVEAPAGAPRSFAHHSPHPCCPTDAAPTSDPHTCTPSSGSGCADDVPGSCASCAVCHGAMIAPPPPPTWALAPQPGPTQPAPAIPSATPVPELRPPIG